MWQHFRRAMTELPSATLRLGRAGLQPAGLLLAVVTVVWALTGMGYFWPVWVLIGLGFAYGLTAAVHSGLSRSTRGDRARRIVAGVGVVTSSLTVVIWLVTSRGYFWPMWNMLGFAVLVVLISRFGQTRERSL